MGMVSPSVLAGEQMMPWPQHLQKPHWGHDGLKRSHRPMWESHAADVMFLWGLLSHCPPSS